MLSRALDTHANLDLPRNVEWIHIVLSFLKTYVEHIGSEMLMHEIDKVEYVSQLVKSLRTSVELLDTGYYSLKSLFYLHQYSFASHRPCSS